MKDPEHEAREAVRRAKSEWEQLLGMPLGPEVDKVRKDYIVASAELALLIAEMFVVINTGQEVFLLGVCSEFETIAYWKEIRLARTLTGVSLKVGIGEAQSDTWVEPGSHTMINLTNSGDHKKLDVWCFDKNDASKAEWKRDEIKKVHDADVGD